MKQIAPKYNYANFTTIWTNFSEVTPMNLHTKFQSNLTCGIGEEDHCWRTDAGRRTPDDDGQSAYRISSASLTAELKKCLGACPLCIYTPNFKTVCTVVLKIFEWMDIHTYIQTDRPQSLYHRSGNGLWNLLSKVWITLPVGPMRVAAVASLGVASFETLGDILPQLFTLFFSSFHRNSSYFVTKFSLFRMMK